MSGFLCACRQTSSASAICGMALGWTNETASMRRTPVSLNASISRTLDAVGIGSSFCRPSRGATSRMLTLVMASPHPADDAGVVVAGQELVVLQQLGEERQVVLGAGDLEAGDRRAGLGDRVGAVDAEDDQLG